jgi:hypothetical protein
MRVDLMLEVDRLLGVVVPLIDIEAAAIWNTLSCDSVVGYDRYVYKVTMKSN